MANCALQAIVNCDTAAEVTALLAQTSRWQQNNIGKITSINTTGKKITIIFEPYIVVPDQ